MRPIDADALVEEIREEIEAEQDYEETGKYITAGLKIALKDILKQSTLEDIPGYRKKILARSVPPAPNSKAMHICGNCKQEIAQLSKNYCANCGCELWWND